MPVVSQTILQSLASMRDEQGAAISVYLDLDPSVSGTWSEASTRATSMIDHLREERLGVGGAAKRRFDFGAQRIHRFLRDEDVRGGHEVHGAALFACGEDTFHAVPLWRSPGDEVSAGRRFALRRLAAADARTSQLMLVIAGRELGRLVLLQDGALIELMDADQEIENRHSQGGWAQSKLQRYTDRQAELHLDRVVDLAERLHARLGRPPIVIAATDDNAAVVRDRFGQEAGAAMIGQLPNVRDFGEAALLKALSKLADAHDRRRERRRLERRAEQIGHHEVGDTLDDALAAISDARVETLLLAPGSGPDVCSCPQCGRLSDHAHLCPLDGSFIQRDPDGINAAVAETITHGGDVWELLDEDRDELRTSGGVGVITRF